MHEIANWRSLPTSLLQQSTRNHYSRCLVRKGDRVKTSTRKGNRTKPDPAPSAVRGQLGNQLGGTPHGEQWRCLCARAAPRCERRLADGGGDRHRHPQEHRGLDRRQEERGLDRRGGVGRGHRQASGFLHRRIDRATARSRRAAHQRSCADAVDPRPRARLHRHDLQRSRAGFDERQPHGRVRPVSVGARHAGQDLQDARCRHGVPGHRGHHRHLDGTSAGVRRAHNGGDLSS